jgi:hypothetical protein
MLGSHLCVLVEVEISRRLVAGVGQAAVMADPTALRHALQALRVSSLALFGILASVTAVMFLQHQVP